MDDAELNALMRRFQALQQEEVANQITERNVVEIVNVLLKKKMIELLYTTDAKEYLTFDELKREIVDEVFANNGRLNVVDLPGLLSVHAYHIEHVLPDILSDPTLRLEAGEIMTDLYLDSTVQAAGDTLREQGSLSITAFATTHRFSSHFARELLVSAVNSGRLSAVLQDNALYTKLFVRSQKVIVRAGLLAAAQPVDLADFFKRHDLFAALMETLVEAVRDELPGTFDGGVYTPDVYERYRTAQVQNLYASNGVVEYAALQRLGISNAKHYMQQRFNPADAADTATAATGAGTSPSPPPPSSRKGGRKKPGAKTSAAAAKETVKIVRASAEHPLCGYPLSSSFLSDRFLSNLVSLEGLADGDALALDLREHLPQVVDVEKDWPLLEARARELYPVLESCDLIEDAVLVHRGAKEKVLEQLTEVLKKEQQQSAAGGKGGKKRKDSQGAVEADGKKDDVVLGVIASVLKLPSSSYDGVLKELAAQWSDGVEEVIAQAEASQANSAAAELKRNRAALQASLDEEWVVMWTVSKGLQWAQGQLDEATVAALNHNILASRGLQLCKSVLVNESLDRPDLHERVDEALSQVQNAGQMKKALGAFPEKTREALQPIAAGVAGKSVEQLMETLQDMSGTGVIAVSSFHAPNKKVERDGYAKLREAVKTEVSTCAFSAADAAANGKLFALLCTLLLHVSFRVHVEVPGKAVSSVVARLAKESDIPSQSLTTVQDAVINSLQSGNVDAAKLPEMEELRAAVLALVQ